MVYHAAEAYDGDVEVLSHCDEWKDEERWFDEIDVDDNSLFLVTEIELFICLSVHIDRTSSVFREVSPMSLPSKK